MTKTRSKNDFSRRDFVKFVGGGALLSAASSCAVNDKAYLSKGDLPLSPISPSLNDELELAEGFEFDLLISTGDALSSSGLRFGANNDYTAFIPLQKNEAILWVNHEYPEALFTSGRVRGSKTTKKMVDLERESIGGSLVHIKRSPIDQKWKVGLNSKYNRRLDGKSAIPLVADRTIEGGRIAIGTFGNCAGGVTPWGSVLSCEENYQNYYGERIFGSRKIKKGFLEWSNFYTHPPEHYGWVVEVNPKTGEAKKLTSLGRFSHECATCVRTSDGRVAVYSGDDKEGEFVYKFLSDSADSLEKGELFVADIKNGKWLSLKREKSPLLKSKFKDQLDVLIHCRQAARLMGATPLDRPEDVEVHPHTGDVFVCLTNNKKRGNYHGSILKISQENKDHGSLNFTASDFLVGGEEFSCPDNLCFDRLGNLWMVTDISGSSIGKGPYTKFKNNGLFYIPTSGPHAGRAFQVASAPVDAELTGLSFSEDWKTLFLCVQHPGENSKSLDDVRSHWPFGGKSLPRSSVVQIHGKTLDRLLKA